MAHVRPSHRRWGLFCDPGTGLINFTAVDAAARDVGFDGPVIVERSLLDSTLEEATATAVRTRRYFESIGLVSA